MTRSGIPKLAPCLAVVVTLLGGCVGDDDSREIDEIVSFGDSLSDVGIYNPTLFDSDPTNDRRTGLTFTTKPGSLWNQYVAAEYRLSLQPVRRVVFGPKDTVGGIVPLGGAGYAEGGAVVDGSLPDGNPLDDIVPDDPSIQGPTARSVSDQIDAYLAERGGFDDDQLVLIQGGANNFFVYFEAVQRGLAPFSEAALQELVAQTAADMVTAIRRLIDNGATNILYANLPNLGAVPSLSDSPLAAAAQQASVAYNEAVAQGLEGTDVVTFDLYALLQAAITRPIDFMLINVQDPACTSTGLGDDVTALLCTPRTLIAPNADQTYLFADGVHPTARGHEIWGRRAAEQAVARFDP
jgi:phospholipase/lecithinase/hemolysin